MVKKQKMVVEQNEFDKIKVDGMDGIYAVWNKLEVEDSSMKTQHLSIENVKMIFLKRISMKILIS